MSVDSLEVGGKVFERGKFSVDFFKPFFKEHRDAFFGEEPISEKQILLLALAEERAKMIHLFSAVKFMDALNLVLPVTGTESIRDWIQNRTAGITVSSETLQKAGFKETEISYLLSLIAAIPETDVADPKRPRASITAHKKPAQPRQKGRTSTGVFNRREEALFLQNLQKTDYRNENVRDLLDSIFSIIKNGDNAPTASFPQWVRVSRDTSGKYSIIIWEDRPYDTPRKPGAPLGEQGGMRARALARALMNSDFSSVPRICTVSIYPEEKHYAGESFLVKSHIPSDIVSRVDRGE